MRVLFCMYHQPCLGRGPLGRLAATQGVGGLPGWTLLGLGGAKGTCWVSITAGPDGRRGPLHWAWPFIITADRLTCSVSSEPWQLWRPQRRGSASGGKDNAAAAAVH